MCHDLLFHIQCGTGRMKSVKYYRVYYRVTYSQVKEHTLRDPHMEFFFEPVFHCMLTPGETYSLTCESAGTEETVTQVTSSLEWTNTEILAYM